MRTTTVALFWLAAMSSLGVVLGSPVPQHYKRSFDILAEAQPTDEMRDGLQLLKRGLLEDAAYRSATPAQQEQMREKERARQKAKQEEKEAADLKRKKSTKKRPDLMESLALASGRKLPRKGSKKGKGSDGAKGKAQATIDEDSEPEPLDYTDDAEIKRNPWKES